MQNNDQVHDTQLDRNENESVMNRDAKDSSAEDIRVSSTTVTVDRASTSGEDTVTTTVEDDYGCEHYKRKSKFVVSPHYYMSTFLGIYFYLEKNNNLALIAILPSVIMRVYRLLYKSCMYVCIYLYIYLFVYRLPAATRYTHVDFVTTNKRHIR